MNPERSMPPNKEGFYEAMTGELGQGKALTSKHVMSIAAEHGYSSHSTARDLMAAPKFRRALLASGINVEYVEYRSRIVYLDGNQPPEETNIEEVRAEIDEDFNRASQRLRDIKAAQKRNK